MRRLPIFLALTCLAAAFVAHPGAAQGAPDTVLAARLADRVRQADLGDQVGIHVVDADTGRAIFGLHADVPLNPASNQKLLTAAAALLRLGADFEMPTGLYGRIEDGVVEELVLRGHGDPTLRMSDLVELAEGLADRGVRRVSRVVVDGGYFDAEILPPAFDQQPDEMASFRAAVGAVAVEGSSYVLRVLPGAAAGEPAAVRLAAPGYFEVENAITTTAGGPPNVIVIQRPLPGGKLGLRLRGSIPLGILGVSYRRRVEDPLRHAGYAMVEALERTGIRCPPRVEVGGATPGLPLLTSRTSPPMSEVLYALGKRSDNFVAEMVLKVLGAERSRPGTSAAGAEVLEGVLADAGVPRGQATIVNGSGLFVGNRIAPSHLTRLLAHVYGAPGVRAEYLAHLAVAGVDGTLHERLTDLPRPRIVRAKTGTLADVIALSGYVLGPPGGRTYAFSFLANGVRGRVGEARQLADDLVRELARSLYGEGTPPN